MASDEKLMKNAQFRKAAPMAFLNARNSAIELLKLEGTPKVVKGKKAKKELTLLERTKKYTEDFMKEYREFYSNEVASIGGNYKAADSIAKLKKAKNLEELAFTWRSLSADERHDGEIIKVKEDLKKKYEKAQ